MKRPLIVAAAAISITAAFVAVPGLTRAGQGDQSLCPAGTIDHKIDSLSGETYTVPDLRPDFDIVAVSVKAGSSEYLYTEPPQLEGRTLNVKTDTGHDVSHVHLCKVASIPTTTTTEPPCTTTSLPSESTSTTTTVSVTTSSTAPPSTTEPPSTSTTTEPGSTSSSPPITNLLTSTTFSASPTTLPGSSLPSRPVSSTIPVESPPLSSTPPGDSLPTTC